MKFTPTTRRLIVACMAGQSLAMTVGMFLGKIDTQSGMMIIVSVNTCFAALLKGVE